MYRYTANYLRTNSNFVIQNLKKCSVENGYKPEICVLKNILQRGCPTKMSRYLVSQIGEVNLDKEAIKLIDIEMPKWINAIKGDAKHNYFPARVFYEELIPKHLSEFKFIQQLMLPEALINEITEVENEMFVDQRVDFYLPQAKLIIEIDGQQHKENDVNRVNDRLRDCYLRRYGFKTIRIETSDLRNENEIYISRIQEIQNRLNTYQNNLLPYKEAIECFSREYDYADLIPAAVIRFQMLILTLLENNCLRLDKEKWDISILEHDVKGFAEAALEDLFIWFENLCKLTKKSFRKPKCNIVHIDDEYGFAGEEGCINIDFSLLKRWTDENIYNNNEAVIFLRNDYYEDRNYFKVSNDRIIDYEIISTGKDSDIPALGFFLKNIFGFDNFFEGQLPIIISALTGKCTIGLLPTGGGKSLCYQLAALLQPGISFVVCPTKALMFDQKENLDKKYIANTNYINGSQSPEERKAVLERFASGKYLFIWIAPERFQSQDFRNHLYEINNDKTIALAVIDEVHCLSEWGHDFRTSYLTLIKTIKNFCPTSRLLGLSATASRAVIKDLTAEFMYCTECIGNDEKVNIKLPLNFTRRELHFNLIEDNGEDINLKYEVLKKVLNTINKDNNLAGARGEQTYSGIIFTPHAGGTFGSMYLSGKLSNLLNTDVKWFAGKKPSGMTQQDFEEQMKQAHEGFKNNKDSMLVATKAYGMGIDKGNVRYTIHYGIPASVEQLYQEAGRAGRDRKAADCYVLYSKEKRNIDYIFNRTASIENIKTLVNNIDSFNGRDIHRNMVLWLTNVSGIEFEVSLSDKIFKRYARPNFQARIYCGALHEKGQNVERCIYRLSLLGIIDDWTVENWSENNGCFNVKFGDYSIEKIFSRLISYIRKYDVNFNLDLNNINTQEYGRYIEIYNNNNFDYINKVLNILITWIYDNIIYQRRQTLKTLYDLCENYTDGETFKRALESYFIYNEKIIVLDHISEHPDDIECWFKAFKDEENKELLDIAGITDLSNAAKRFLETYRYNIGLDFISGLSDIVAARFSGDIRLERFEDALNKIKRMDKRDKDYILGEIFKIARLIQCEKNRDYLGLCLCRILPERTFEIYKNLSDIHSLNMILEDSINRIEIQRRRIV